MKIYVHLTKHRAGALVIVFQICYHHTEPLKCLYITCNSTCLLKTFCPIAHLFVKLNEVVQVNEKIPIKAELTFLHLFDFMIIAQIIVRHHHGSCKYVCN